MNRTGIINALITRYDYKRYLEIGVYKPKRNFDKVQCIDKCGVDPAPKAAPKEGIVYKKTSDEFFAFYTGPCFNLVFVDGLHTQEQVALDVRHSLACLADKGTIVVHDCNPPTEYHQRAVKGSGSGPWNGTVWKAFVWLRMSDANLKMCVVDTDCGVGIIQRGSQTLFPLMPLSFGLLDANRRELLNLISVKEFKRRYVFAAGIY